MSDTAAANKDLVNLTSLIDTLNEASRNGTKYTVSDEKLNRPADEKIDFVEKYKEGISNLADDYGVRADICNDIDIRSANISTDKFFVRITNIDTDENVLIGLSKYIEDPDDCVREAWINLFGQKPSIDEVDSLIIFISICMQKELKAYQICMYSQMGWLKPNDRTGDRWLFKYNYIFPNTDLRGELKERFRVGIGPDDDQFLKEYGYTEGDFELTDDSDYADDQYDKEDRESILRSEIDDNFPESKYPHKINYDELLANEVYRELNRNIRKQPDVQWADFVLHLMNAHPLDRLIFGAGLSGILRQLLNLSKDTSITLNIVGRSGCGKTTIEGLMMSAFGNPEELIGNFTDTDNAIEVMRASRVVLPYVIDDRLIRFETESEDRTAYSILSNIFRESEGRVKQRYNSNDGGVRAYGALISSSVKSITDILMTFDTDIGQNRRFIEIYAEGLGLDDQVCAAVNPSYNSDEIDGRLFTDATEVAASDKQAFNNYGYGLYIFIAYLLRRLNDSTDGIKSIGHEYYSIVEKYQNYLLNVEKQDRLLQGRLISSAKRFALIDYTSRLFIESLKEVTGDSCQINEFELPYILINNLVDKIRKSDVIYNDVVRITTYLKAHRDYFADTEDEYEKHMDHKLGYIVEQTSDHTKIRYLTNKHLEMFLFCNVIMDPDEILEMMKNDKNTLKKKIHGIPSDEEINKHNVKKANGDAKEKDRVRDVYFSENNKGKVTTSHYYTDLVVKVAKQ